MDIKKRIQELTLDQKAKLYFLGLLRKGVIDTLPEDPKAAYVSMMMDKDDYGRSISGKDKRTFMEPEDSMPAARARKLAGMEDDEMETRYDYDDPIFENYDKQSLLKALGSADDAIIQTHVSPDPLGRGYEKGAGPDGDFGYGDYRLDGQEYLIYNPNSNNKDSAAMWNSNDYVVALDKDGEKYKIAYSDIMRINSSINEGDTYEKMAAKGKKAGNLKQGTVRKRLRIKDGEKIPLARINKAISGLKKRKSLSDKDKKYLKALNLAKTLKTTTNVKEIATELGYLNESKVDISYTDPGFRFYKMKVDGKRLDREEGTEYLKGLGIDMEIPRSYNQSTLDKIVGKLKEKGIDADHDAAMDVS